MINSNPLDVKNLFGVPVPKWSEPVRPTVELSGPAAERDYSGGLVAAAGKRIYLLLGKGDKGEITQAAGVVTSMCGHKGDLYYARKYPTGGGIDRVHDPSHFFISSTEDISWVSEYGGELVHNMGKDVCWSGEARDLHAEQSHAMCTYELEDKPVICLAQEDAIKLYVHRPQGKYSGIYAVLLLDGGCKPTAICSHGKSILHNDLTPKWKNTVFELSKIRLVVEGQEAIVGSEKMEKARRSDKINALCSDGKTVYDGGDYRAVFDTLDDPEGRNPLWTFDEPVTALTNVDIDVWAELCKLTPQYSDWLLKNS